MAEAGHQPFWQEIARVGTYRLKDGQSLRITPDDAKNCVEQGNAMLKEGIRVPFAWEHPPDALPTYQLSHAKEWMAKGYFGEPKEYKLDGDKVLGLMDVPDPKDREQFAKVKTVSPRLFRDWTDEKGKVWSGMTISHVAASPKPVQRDQTPAELSGLAESIKGTLPNSTVTFYDLSAADYSEPDSSSPSAGKGKALGIGRIVGLIEKCGLKLGRNVTDEDDLCGRLEALAANRQGGDLNDPNSYATSVDDDSLTPASSGAGPMLMSQLPEPVRKAAAGIIERERKELMREAEEFVKKGMIAPSVGAKHKANLKSADLSFTDDGELTPIAVIVTHQAYRDLLPNNAFTKKSRPALADLSNLEDADESHELNPDPAAQEAADAAARDAMLARVGMTFKAAK